MITEIPLENFVQDITNKYYYIYLPDHELATKSGKVYMHRYVMAQHLGRSLLTDEVVHHKDEDRTNNNLSNLELLSNSDHARHHIKLSEWKEVQCTNCGKVFERSVTRLKNSQSENMFCSRKCNSTFTRVFEVDEEVLRDLVWSMPTIKVAELFGVSDKAVEKRCKTFGIQKPPRGYWRRVEVTKLKEENTKGT